LNCPLILLSYSPKTHWNIVDRSSSIKKFNSVVLLRKEFRFALGDSVCVLHTHRSFSSLEALDLMNWLHNFMSSKVDLEALSLDFIGFLVLTN